MLLIICLQVGRLVGKSVKISFSLVLFIYRDEWQFERNGPWAASHPHAKLLPRPNCTQPNYSHQENVYLNRNVQTLRLKLTWTISYESTRSSHSEIGVQYPEDVNVEKNLKNQSTSASLYHSLPRTIRFFFFFFMIWDSQRMVRCLHSLPVFLEILLDTVFSFFSLSYKTLFFIYFFFGKHTVAKSIMSPISSNWSMWNNHLWYGRAQQLLQRQLRNNDI